MKGNFFSSIAGLCLAAVLFCSIQFFPAKNCAAQSFEPLFQSETEPSYLLAAAPKARKKPAPAKRKPVKQKQLGDIRTDYISLGGGFYKYDKDFWDPEAEENGSYGIVTARLQFKVSYLMISLFGDYTKHEADYMGITSTGETVDGQIENMIGRAGCTMGFSYAFSSRFNLTAPYAGLEYRHWKKKGIPGGINIDERYEWFVLPAGIKLQYQLLSGFVAGVDISGGLTRRGRATIFTAKNTDPDSLDVPEDEYPIFCLKGGWYYRGELPLEFYLGKSIGFELCTWYEYTSLGDYKVYTINVNEEITSSKIEIRAMGVNLSFRIYF